jgi:endonuclease G
MLVIASIISLSVSVAIPMANTSHHEILQYSHYSLQYDCKEKRADRFTYTLTSTIDGIAKRPQAFNFDPTYKKECQQFSNDAYGNGYDRGHLVTSSHMDMDRKSRLESHYVTNMLPQVGSFNKGIWQATEQISSCIRESRDITVYGGVIFDDPSNDIFLKSHGVKTPDYWWKVLVTKGQDGNTNIISWLFPNQEGLGALDQYLVSVAEIESKINDDLGPIPIPAKLKGIRLAKSWGIGKQCL